jgi:hypothetical protein
MKQRNNFLYHPIAGNFIAWFVGIGIMSFYVNGESNKTGLMIIGIFVGSFWTINLHAYREAERISLGKEINHVDRFWVRLCIGSVAAALIHLLAFGNQYFWGAAVFGAIYFGAIFWLLFDFLLNYHRGKSLFYVSSYYKSSMIDKWFSKFNPQVRCVLWLGSKLLIFVISVLLYHFALVSTQRKMKHENHNDGGFIIYRYHEPCPDATV